MPLALTVCVMQDARLEAGLFCSKHAKEWNANVDGLFDAVIA
jgi:hypothetical protein